MMIPGEFIALVTFPGIIVHEMAHLLFCRWMGVAVFEVCYFRLGNPSGYVVHEAPRTFKQSFFISMGPLFINTLMGAVIAFPGMIPVWSFDSGGDLEKILVWLGVSIAMHAFPSKADADALWNSSIRFHGDIAQALAAPLIGLIHIVAIGSMAWLDLIFGIAVCCAIPKAIIFLLA